MVWLSHVTCAYYTPWASPCKEKISQFANKYAAAPAPSSGEDSLPTGPSWRKLDRWTWENTMQTVPGCFALENQFRCDHLRRIIEGGRGGIWVASPRAAQDFNEGAVAGSRLAPGPRELKA